MKPSGLETAVTVNVRNDLEKQSVTQLSICSLSTLGKLKYATKSLAICWGIALLCVFIPVLHFFLVPLGLIIGLFLFYRNFQFQELLIDGKISCPACRHDFEAKKIAFNWPKQESCSACDLELILKKQI